MARTALGCGMGLALMAAIQPVAAARLDGANGFEQAMRQHERSGTPVALFVYTDWCPHCRVFIQKLLDTPTVRRYMDGISEVWLNPEKGSRERAVANTYGVRGYPTFLMFPGDSTQPRPVERMVRQGNQWELKSPSAFVESCQAVAGTPRPLARRADSTRARRLAPSKTPSGYSTSARASDASSAAATVTVYLTDGKVVRGRLAGETSDVVLIDTGTGQEIYLRDMIDRLVKDSP